MWIDNIERLSEQVISGDITKLPHDIVYAVPRGEVDMGYTMPGLEKFVGRSDGVQLRTLISPRQFLVEAGGQTFNVGLRVTTEFGSGYAVDFRPIGPIDGIDYQEFGFFNRAAAMILDDLYSTRGDGNLLLRNGIVKPHDLRKVIQYNVVSRLPMISEGGIDRKPTGKPKYSDRRHPVIKAKSFLEWGLDHMDKMPKGVCIDYGVTGGDVSAALMTWEMGEDNYLRFFKGYSNNGSDVRSGLDSTFTVPVLRALGFKNVRSVMFDYPINPQIPVPAAISVLVTRQRRQKPAAFITKTGAGEVTIENANL